MFTRVLKNCISHISICKCMLDEEPFTFVFSNFTSSGSFFLLHYDMLFYYLRLECVLVTVTHLSCILWCDLITSHFFSLSYSAFHLSVTVMTPASGTVIPGLCISAYRWQFLRVILYLWCTILFWAGYFWREEPFVITSKTSAINHFRCRR